MTRIWIFAVFIIGLIGVSEASLCSARGRFPNENVPNCQGYTMCLQGAPGTYTQLDLNCPDNFAYSHLDSQCTNVTSYQCYPEYHCVKIGNFEASGDKKCVMYVACVQGLSNIATARLVHCPENTLYNPLEGACVNSSMFTCDTADTPNVLEAAPSQESSNTSSNNAVNLFFKYYAMFVCVMFGIVI